MSATSKPSQDGKLEDTGFFARPNQSDEERLNRFQTVLAGLARWVGLRQAGLLGGAERGEEHKAGRVIVFPQQATTTSIWILATALARIRIILCDKLAFCLCSTTARLDFARGHVLVFAKTLPWPLSPCNSRPSGCILPDRPLSSLSSLSAVPSFRRPPPPPPPPPPSSPSVTSGELLGFIEDKRNLEVSQLLHGPMRGKDATDKDALVAYFNHMSDQTRMGNQHKMWEKFQVDAAKIDPALRDDVMGINTVIPRIIAADEMMPWLDNVVLIGDADDAARIARIHVKKQPNFTPFLFQSLIATTDNEHWRRQREHLNEVFLPHRALAKIFPTSLARAQTCAERLAGLGAASGRYGVQMHEFYLHEAQAQLQMALFGMDEEFMERTNKKIRDVFAGVNPDPNFGKDMCLEMMRQVGGNSKFAKPSDQGVLAGRKPVFGPLSKSVADASKELDMNLFDQFGNMMLILFAGHDTTAHTMTWMTYELARHPEYQRRVQAEVDALFDELEREGREMSYEDCGKLPFMTKCAMETLRLWTAVPNGTFRELQFDETVKGPGGKPVTLPKGTYVQVVNWLRQRNPTLWGADAHEFNPDRDFQGDEVWGAEAFSCYNPSSKRFSPFTFAPRDCLGKNFAQMEIRTIMSNVLRRFTFELSEPYASYDPARDGPIENAGGTMGPKDLTPEGRAESKRRFSKRQGPKMGMWLKVKPRTAAAAGARSRL